MTNEATPPAIPERPLLRGERVWLRPLEERDMPAYVAGMNDTEVGGMAGYKWPLSVAQATSWLERTLEESKSGRGFFFAVCELGDDQFIGTVWLKEVNLVDGNAELAIFMDRDHIGSGYGSDAQRAILGFAFLNLGLQRVWLTAYAANERAIRSYERLGFRHEGRLRKSWRGPRGLEDTVLMGILWDEWLQPGEAVPPRRKRSRAS
ncbi:MAG: GNAT family N-acetyltransferase [Chloroflexi bacterium]|nr:MAG: GNAT family N-acetyltransferase [Chloroflexota bacterium]